MILRFTIRYPDVGSVILFPCQKPDQQIKIINADAAGNTALVELFSTNQEPMTKSYWDFFISATEDIQILLDHAVRLHQAE
ncbi:hypothetical protein P7H16_15000 [Paenibacillus larvae]|nr:hypothetical protein [Paenibacillus larvae]MDT2247969.1 hypothetical protein [Paenibacillus larvae]